MLLPLLPYPSSRLGLCAAAACLASATAFSAEFTIVRALDHQRDFDRYSMASLHGETVVEYPNVVANVETGELLAAPRPGKIETLLSFDSASGRSAWLTEDGAVEARAGQETIVELDRYAPYYSEAGIAAGGDVIVARGTDADTFAVTLEARALPGGELLWQRARPERADWLFMPRAGAILEMQRPAANQPYKTAKLIDMETQSILAELNVSSLQIKFSVGEASSGGGTIIVVEGAEGSLIVNGARGKLIAKGGYFAGGADPYAGLAADAGATRVALFTKAFMRPTGEPPRKAFACFDAVTGALVATSEQLTSAQASSGGPWAPTFSADGSELYVVAGLGRVEAWDLATRTLRRTFTYSNIPFTTLYPSADGQSVLAGALDSALDDLVALLQAGKEGFRYQKVAFNAIELGTGPGLAIGYTTSLTATPGRTRFYIESPRGGEAFDFETGAPLEIKPPMLGRAVAVAYVSALERWMVLYSSGWVETSRSPVGPAEQRYRLESGYEISAAAIDPESGAIAYARQGASYVERPAGAPLSTELPGAPNGSEAYTFLDNGKLVHVSYRGIFDTATGAQLLETPTLYRPLAADPARARFAQAAKDGSVAIHDASNGSVVAQSEEAYATPRIGAFSPDGQTLYFVAAIAEPHLRRLVAIDMTRGQELASWDLGSSEFSDFDYLSPSPDGRFAFLGGARGEIATIDLETGALSEPGQIGPAPDSITEFKTRRLSNVAPDGRVCYIGRDDARYLVAAAAARSIPVALSLSPDQRIEAAVDFKADRKYWIQASPDLRDWLDHPSLESAVDWLNARLQTAAASGYLRSIESEDAQEAEK